MACRVVSLLNAGSIFVLCKGSTPKLWGEKVVWIEFEFDEFTRVPFLLLLHPRSGLCGRVVLIIITWEAFGSARPEWEDILLA
ncbi:dihydroxy-acid dehydratase [Aspergillus luchuensis]|uniref:Dihydroxy-acid dehydratase n=1 Tax=Aspergillus kawachii TaxID=1069201 RepID=A0A146F2H2_ASPKA|nr:dihydroxy-acid dehydratase [Aspergillus luchuensis]